MTTLSIVCAWAVIAADPSAIAPPTYRLEVGQQIEATSDSQGLSSFDATEAPNPEAKIVYRWTFRVIDRNDERGWRIVVRQVKIGNTSGVFGIDMASFWLTPQGILTWDESRSGWHGDVDPDELFPRLPTASELLAGSWEQQEVCDAVRWTYSDVMANDPLLRFGGARQSPILSVAGGKSEFVFEFDLRDGLVSSVQSGSRYPSHNEFYTGTAKLKREESFSPEDVRQFRQEWDRWVSTLEVLHIASGRTGIRAAHPNGVSSLPAAIESMRESLGQFKCPEIREQAERQLASATKSVERQTQLLAERAARLDQPAPDWSVKDLEGKSHSLKQYRGQVVLLDFWFRRCAYCMQLTPQLHRVAQSFEGKPFVLLSMNTDDDVEDARIGAERLGLTGPVLLHANDVATSLGVSSFPTLVLVDAEGNVQDLFAGYSPNREAELRTAINRLLSQQ